MNIGLLIPSIYAQKKYLSTRISAPMALLNLMASSFAQAGHNVTVYAGPGFTIDNSNVKVVSFEKDLLASELMVDYEQDISKESYKSLSLYEKKKYYELGASIQAYEHASKNDIQIMHVYHSFSSLAHYLHGYYSIPSFFTLHNPTPEKGTFRHWRLNRFSQQNFIMISEKQKSEHKKLIPNLNVVDVIYHGVDLNTYQYIENAEDYLVFIGRAVLEKGLHIALQASEETQKKLFILTWINDIIKKSTYFQNHILPFKNNRNNKFFDLVTEKERINIVNKAKFLLFPIHWEEPFGMVLIESMASGTPVIAFAQGSSPEIVVDGVTGFLVNYSDDDIRGDFIIKKTGFAGIQEAIQKGYSLNKKDYSTMRNSARARVEKYFTSKNMIKNHLSLYQKYLLK